MAAKAREYGVNAAVQSATSRPASGQLQAVQQHQSSPTGHLDILVLNAATFAAAPIEDADLSDFDKLYQLNVRAPYALTQAFSPMLKARHGQVVFINSSSGIAAKPMTGADMIPRSTPSRRSPTAFGRRSTLIAFECSASILGERQAMQERIYQMEGRPYRAEYCCNPRMSHRLSSTLFVCRALPK